MNPNGNDVIEIQGYKTSSKVTVKDLEEEMKKHGRKSSGRRILSCGETLEEINELLEEIQGQLEATHNKMNVLSQRLPYYKDGQQTPLTVPSTQNRKRQARKIIRFVSFNMKG